MYNGYTFLKKHTKDIIKFCQLKLIYNILYITVIFIFSLLNGLSYLNIFAIPVGHIRT